MKHPEYAQCDQCGWHGPISALVDGPGAIDEACPECGAADPWWTDEAPEFSAD